MDDNTFDDLLKQKLKNYEDQSIDPSALDDFHERISNFQADRWYSKRAATLALAASLLIFTGINAYLLVKNLNTAEKGKIIYLSDDQRHQGKIDSLLAVIDRLQGVTLATATPYPAPISPAFHFRLVKTTAGVDPSVVDWTYKVGIGSRGTIPEEMYDKLQDAGFLTTENGELFLTLSKKTNLQFQTALRTRPTDLLVPVPPVASFHLVALNDQVEKKKMTHSVSEGKTSLAARNALEKHYFNKLGILLAPHGDVMKGIYSRGTGVITPRVGITVDWVLSPRFSVESGIDYGTTGIHFTGSEIERAPYNQQLGNLESATLANRLLSMPLSIKYRQWVFDKSQLILRAGYTPYGLLSKQYQYNYVRPDVNPDVDGDHISTIEKRNENKFFGSTITASAGLTINREKSKNSWEASLFYEHGVGNGFDHSGMQLIGLRTAYWFKLR